MRSWIASCDRIQLVGLPAGVLLAALLGALVSTHRPTTLAAVIALALIGIIVVANPTMAIVVSVLGLALPISGWGQSLGSERTRLIAIVALASLGLFATWARGTAVLSHKRIWPRAALLIGFLMVQVSTAAFPRPVAQRMLEVTVALIVAGVTSWSIRYDERSFERALGLIVGFMSAEAVLASLQLILSRPLLMGGVLSETSQSEARNIGGYFRGIGTFYHANGLALASALTIPIALTLARWPVNHRGFLRLLPTLILSAGIIASLSRAGILALGLIAICMGAIALKTGRLLRLILVASLSLGLLFSVTPLRRATARFTSGEVNMRDQGADRARAADLSASFAAFRQNVLVGQGFGASAEEGIVFGGYPGQGAHNAYLDFLEGGGIALATLFAFLILPLGRPWLKAWRCGDPLAFCLPLACVYGLFESILQGMYVVLLGIALSTIYARYSAVSEQ